MRLHYRANRAAFRRAVGASVALHVVAACALLLFVRLGETPKPARPGIDTHAADEPQVRMHPVEEVVSVEVHSAPVAPAPPQAAAQATPQVVVPTTPQVSVRPQPQALPSEMLAHIRKSATQPASATNTNITDPNVKPAGGAASHATGAPAIHGALKPNQTVVYVLDCSGSMGAAGKLDAARAALVATLRQQPASVRFQVLVYSGSAKPLLASGGSALPVTEANVRAATEKLAALEARGKSNHTEAIRAALEFRPDVILLLTDATELTAAALKPLLAGSAKPAAVRLGQVNSEGVQPPRELK